MKFHASVRDISKQGMGVVDHPDGRIFFVPGVWPGDAGEFEIVEAKRRYGFARLLNLQESSADRIPVPCPHQGFAEGRCGGCPWMMAAYPAQLKIKEHLIRHSLARAHIETTVAPIVASAQISHYRNRAQFKTDGSKMGFVAARSKELVDVTECLVLNEGCSHILQKLRERLPNEEWEPSESYLWNFIEVDDEQTVEALALNRRLPFRQGNSGQNENMRQWLYNQVGDGRFSQALELFCGSGNFTEVLSRSGIEKILALEVNAKAIGRLQEKALPRVDAHAVDLERSRALPPHLADGKGVDLLLLDPPREGFKYLPSWVAEMKGLKQILYISCEIQNMIRDVLPLLREGWGMALVQPFDLFPHTPHIEVMSVLRR